MSLQAVIARVTEIQSVLAPVRPAATPPAPAAPATATPAASPFATQLQAAIGAPAAATPTAAAPGTYPHLTGDLDASPELLQKLDALAAQRGETFNVTSGLRTVAEQQRLWDNRHNNPYPVARPGTSRHQDGRAADVTIRGQAIQTVIGAAELRAAGLVPLAGDAVHVELP